MLTIDEISQKFDDEFSFVKNRFVIHDLSIADATNSKEPAALRPGVYVFWSGDRVIKVGRHFINAKKRALEHIRDDTGGTMQQLKDDPAAHLLLFLLQDPKDIHWVAALEVFFELNLNPEVRSRRLG